MIKESDVLERIGETIDELGLDGLAELYNHLTNYDPINGDDIVAESGWHLVPKQSA